MLYNWRSEALDKLPMLFEMKMPDEKLHEREAELEQIIGQLTMAPQRATFENQMLKKTSRTPSKGCPWLSGLSSKPPAAGGKHGKS